MKLKMKHIAGIILFSVLWILVLGAIFKHYKTQFLLSYQDFINNTVHVEFDLAIHEARVEPEQGEFYYDTGSGFNENETVKFTYTQNRDGHFKHYVVPLNPHKSISLLRFDPLQSEGRITIKNIVVWRYHREPIGLNPSEHSWSAYNGIGQIIPVPPKGMQILADDNDPHLLLTDNLSGYYQGNLIEFLRSLGWTKIAAGLGFVLFILLIGIFL